MFKTFSLSLDEWFKLNHKQLYSTEKTSYLYNLYCQERFQPCCAKNTTKNTLPKKVLLFSLIKKPFNYNAIKKVQSQHIYSNGPS